MAPRRLLNKMVNRKVLSCFYTIILGLMIASCGTTKKTTKGPGSTTIDKSKDNNTATVSDAFVRTLDQNRSDLDDVYSSQQNTIPAIFKEKANYRDIGDPNEGYRIQILSTRSVSQADSLAKNFRSWVDEMNPSYAPKAYVLFKQPYYKVHIGNFQFHDQAQKLTQKLKSRYPGAWVVHDSIEPDLVPADTTQFKVPKK